MTAVILHRWRSWRRSLSLNSRTTRGSSLAGSPSHTGPRRRSPGRGWTQCGPTTRALSGEETGGPEDAGHSRIGSTQGFLRCWSLWSSRDLGCVFSKDYVFHCCGMRNDNYLPWLLEKSSSWGQQVDGKPLFLVRWQLCSALFVCLDVRRLEKAALTLMAGRGASSSAHCKGCDSTPQMTRNNF